MTSLNDCSVCGQSVCVCEIVSLILPTQCIVNVETCLSVCLSVAISVVE